MKEAEKLNLTDAHHSPLTKDHQILIGTVGNFTKDEIEIALQKGFIPVSLGKTRLRSETEGIVAAILLRA